MTRAAYRLADSCYDVWMINFRGNVYSRRHQTRDPEHKDFWKFSWDEMATKDLPAAIDFCLKETSEPSLNYVGFSMGTTTFLALLCDRPGYNQKVKSAALMGPAIFTGNIGGILGAVKPFSKSVDTLISLVGTGEFLPASELMYKFNRLSCSKGSPTAQACYLSIGLLGGFNMKEVNKDWLPLILSHIPAGTSFHTIHHFTQDGFLHYNYGFLGNLMHYGKLSPPPYKLENVKVPLALYYGAGDFLADPTDVLRLKQKLPNNPTEFHEIEDQWSHFDFIWSKSANELVYKRLIEFLQKNQTTA